MIRKMLALLLVGAAAALPVAPSLAHEEFRVIGTVTKHDDTTIEVESRDGKRSSIKLDKQTTITRDKSAVDATELMVGVSVVVDAFGDTLDDLLALEIRIVPPIR